MMPQLHLIANRRRILDFQHFTSLRDEPRRAYAFPQREAECQTYEPDLAPSLLHIASA
jgi:hypothetical protein